jgi:hypothetical protein
MAMIVLLGVMFVAVLNAVPTNHALKHTATAAPAPDSAVPSPVAHPVELVNPVMNTTTTEAAPITGMAGSGVAAAVAQGFTATAQIDSLYPGAEQSLNVAVVNGTDHPITITSLTAASVISSKAACSPATVTVQDFHGHLIVGPSAASGITVGVTMSPYASDDCSDASFSLSFGGTTANV